VERRFSYDDGGLGWVERRSSPYEVADVYLAAGVADRAQDVITGRDNAFTGD
jgi:hypothetical protein